MKAAYMPLILAALANIHVAHAQQEKTLEGAHSFLGQILSRGTTRLLHPTKAPEVEMINNYSGEECESSLTVDSSRGEYEVVVNWAGVSNVVSGATSIFISGGTRVDGKLSTTTSIEADSSAMGKRIGAAMAFLQESCDDSGGHGF